MSGIVALLLAAGQSERFGAQNKLLHKLETQVPMGLQCARNMRAAVDDSLVITRPDDLEFQSLLSADDIRFATNANHEQGMSSSIICGIQATADAAAWLILLADMPHIKPQVISDAATLLRQNPAALVVTRYQEQWGHPTGFSRRYRQQLLALRGDVGAKSVLKKHQSRILYNDASDNSVLVDMDYSN